MFTSSTQLQSRSFHVVERTKTSSKCPKLKNARAKRAEILFFYCQICKFATFLVPSSPWLLKLSNIVGSSIVRSASSVSNVSIVYCM